MYINYYDNRIPLDIHEAAYEYLQTQEWYSRYRNVPDSNTNSSNYKDDLIPYVAKKTVYYAPFGNDYNDLQNHKPIAELFDYINSSIFNNTFELAGAPLGYTENNFSDKELDDYLFEKEFKGNRAYMQVQPYERVKRTRVPYRDCLVDDSDDYYTLVFVANKVWKPEWQAEMLFYNNGQDSDVGWLVGFVNNIPGRLLIYNSHLLHNSKPTSSYADELSQRIEFRVKLKEGESLVRF